MFPAETWLCGGPDSDRGRALVLGLPGRHSSGVAWDHRIP